MELKRTLETTAVCETTDFKGSKLNDLERMTKAAVIGSLPTDATADGLMTGILKELLDVWQQPESSLTDVEITVSILRHMLSASQNLTFRLDRHQFLAILTRV